MNTGTYDGIDKGGILMVMNLLYEAFLGWRETVGLYGFFALIKLFEHFKYSLGVDDSVT